MNISASCSIIIRLVPHKHDKEQLKLNFTKMERSEDIEHHPNKVYFVEHFLLPKLNENAFGNKLFWSNKREGRFKILWKDNRNHQNGEAELNSEVFTSWLQMKLGKDKITKSYSKRKDTFRSCLHSKGKGKEDILERLCDDGDYREYRFRNLDDYCDRDTSRVNNMQQLDEYVLTPAETEVSFYSPPKFNAFDSPNSMPEDSPGSEGGLADEDVFMSCDDNKIDFKQPTCSIEDMIKTYLDGKKFEQSAFDDLDVETCSDDFEMDIDYSVTNQGAERKEIHEITFTDLVMCRHQLHPFMWNNEHSSE